MFKKTAIEKQVNLFCNIPDMLNGTARKRFGDSACWHNQFRKDVFNRIDESIYKDLFDQKMGAPNVGVRLLIGMMILKEGYGWSDSQMFEECHFNLLVRGAIGLLNIDDKVPAESTYYLFRQKVNEYFKKEGIDLIGKTFSSITSGQAIEYMVSGRSIRMDSKLIGSNIAWCGRYELIHQTISLFCMKAEKDKLGFLSESEQKLVDGICGEKGEKVVYRSTREEVRLKLDQLGILMYKLLNIFDCGEAHYPVLERVFNEQYRIESDLVVLRPKEELAADNVQSPHDTDCTYRKKDDQQVKGYSVNLTETCDKENLNLITDIQVAKAGTADNAFVQPATENNILVLGHAPENIHTDGAYYSKSNDNYCQGNDDEQKINFYNTGMQGAPGKYDLEMADGELIVTDTKTGERIPCQQRKTGNWRINTTDGYRYFSLEQIESCQRRKTIEDLSYEIKNIRNNVEASIFQLSFHTRNNKTRYRGIFKNKMWATMRCLWINFRRILNWVGKVCPNGSVFNNFVRFFQSIVDFQAYCMLFKYLFALETSKSNKMIIFV